VLITQSLRQVRFVAASFRANPKSLGIDQINAAKTAKSLVMRLAHSLGVVRKSLRLFVLGVGQDLFDLRSKLACCQLAVGGSRFTAQPDFPVQLPKKRAPSRPCFVPRGSVVGLAARSISRGYSMPHWWTPKLLVTKPIRARTLIRIHSTKNHAKPGHIGT
jgi:hypothetical protein